MLSRLYSLFVKTIIVLAIPSLFLSAHADDPSGVDAAVKLFTVKVNTKGNGSITPPGKRKVNKNTVVEFTVTPDDGYVVANVKGCGGDIITPTPTPGGWLYATAPIVANCKVTARFKKKPEFFAVQAKAKANGRISPRGKKTVSRGTVLSFKVTPKSGYRIKRVTGCNGSLSGTTYTTAAITASCNVIARFKARPVAEPTLSFVPGKLFRFSWSDVAGATAYRLLENPDGVSGFSQVGGDITPGTEVFDHYVPLYKRVNAEYILQSCFNSRCIDSDNVAVSGTLADSVGYFKASNAGEYDQFGNSISLSGDGSTLAVGAFGEDSDATGVDGDQSNNNTLNSGAVYVFIRDSGNTWTQQAYIKASNTDVLDDFGYSVSLSHDGNTLAVGSNSEASDATGVDGDQSNNNAFNSGAVYVFSRDSGNTWTQQAYIKASNTDTLDFFGDSVSLSPDGNTLAVGAHGEDSDATGVNGDQSNNNMHSSGAVYVFSRDSGNTWTQEAYIKASNTDRDTYFGGSVSLSHDGNTLAVGSFLEDSDATGVNGDQWNHNQPYSGAVYVFIRDSDNTWTQQAYIKSSNTDSRDSFGASVSLSDDGSTLAVGAREEDSDATGVNGDQSNNNAPYSGAVYVFIRDSGNTWTQEAYIKASNTDTGDSFGALISLLSGDGNTLAVGAIQEASNATGVNGDQWNNNASGSGAVYVFSRDSGNTWTQQSYIKASNTDTGDSFGYSVSLSHDGNTLAVGAVWEGIGVSGDQSDKSAGAVYLY